MSVEVSITPKSHFNMLFKNRQINFVQSLRSSHGFQAVKLYLDVKYGENVMYQFLTKKISKPNSSTTTIYINSIYSI